MNAPIMIRMLGSLEVTYGDNVVSRQFSLQTALLLAVLALNHGRSIPREELMLRFWPDADTETGRHNLRQLLYALRRTLDLPHSAPSLVETTRSAVQLNWSMVSTDAYEFETTLVSAANAPDSAASLSALLSALTLYRGELLPGLSPDPVLAERRRLSDLYHAALRRVISILEECGHYDEAARYLRVALAQMPQSEELHVQMMRIYAVMGMPLQIASQYDELAAALRRVGQEPSPVSRQLAETLAEAANRTALRRLTDAHHVSAQELAANDSILGSSVMEQGETGTAPRSRGVAPRWLVGLAIMIVAAAALGEWRLRAHAPRMGPQPLRPHEAPSLSFGREEWFRWVDIKAGDGFSEPTNIALGKDGSITVCGFVDSAGTNVDFLVVRYDASDQFLWEKRFDCGAHRMDRAHSVAVDSDGSVYVTGISDGGHGTGSSPHRGWDIATIKLDSEGNPRWHHTYDGTAHGEDTGCKVLLDPAGNLYVCGASTCTGHNGHTHRCIVLLKYTRDGNLRSTVLYGRDREECSPADMVVDGVGNVTIVGKSKGQGRTSEYVTLRYDAQGSLRWSKRFYDGAARGDEARAVALDGSGGVYVTGQSSGVTTLHYDASGLETWRDTYRAGTDGEAKSLCVDSSGSVYVAGWTGNTDYGQYLLLKYLPAGKLAWNRTVFGTGGRVDKAVKVGTDAAGFIYITGEAWNGFPDAGGTGSDVLTARFDPEGSPVWLRAFNGPAAGSDGAKAMAVDAQGHCYVAAQSDDGRRMRQIVMRYEP